MYYILKVGSLIKYFAGFPGKRTGIRVQVIHGINTNKLAKRMLVGIDQQFPQIVWENAFLERFFLDVCGFYFLYPLESTATGLVP